MKHKLTKNRTGFTLVEVLVAMMILVIGVLAVSQMTIMGMQTSRSINRQMYARDILNRYFENLQLLPTTDSSFHFHTSITLDDTATADYKFSENNPGGRYRIFWNVRDSLPDHRFKTIRIHVFWPGSKRGLHSDLLKRF